MTLDHPNKYYEHTCDMLYNNYMEEIKKTNKYWENHRKQFSNALGELLFAEDTKFVSNDQIHVSFAVYL